MIITRTPFRVSFFGGGSDYPSYFSKFGGAVLGTTIDKYCWLIVRKSPPLGPRYKIVYSKVELCDSWNEIQHPAVKQVLADLGYVDGVEVYYTGDLPARTGIGSSSAFVVGLIKAITTLDKEYWAKNEDVGIEHWSAERIAEEATYIEQYLLHETVGCQDQLLCSYGGLNTIHFPVNSPPFITPVFRSESEYRKCATILERHLMLLYTGVQRAATDVAATYVDKLEEHKSVMFRLVDMVQEGKEILQSMAHGGNPDDFGLLLHEAWNLKKKLGSSISSPEIDSLYAKAIQMGAIGGKLLGAGGGGFLLLFVRPEQQHKIREALALPHVPFCLEGAGCQVIPDFDSKEVEVLAA